PLRRAGDGDHARRVDADREHAERERPEVGTRLDLADATVRAQLAHVHLASAHGAEHVVAVPDRVLFAGQSCRTLGAGAAADGRKRQQDASFDRHARRRRYYRASPMTSIDEIGPELPALARRAIERFL